MRHLVRSLILAAVLAVAFSKAQVALAATCSPAHPGVCSITCARCTSDAGCPKVIGHTQTCLCVEFCP